MSSIWRKVSEKYRGMHNSEKPEMAKVGSQVAVSVSLHARCQHHCLAPEEKHSSLVTSSDKVNKGAFCSSRDHQYRDDYFKINLFLLSGKQFHFINQKAKNGRIQKAYQTVENQQIKLSLTIQHPLISCRTKKMRFTKLSLTIQHPLWREVSNTFWGWVEIDHIWITSPVEENEITILLPRLRTKIRETCSFINVFNDIIFLLGSWDWNSYYLLNSENIWIDGRMLSVT